jgi:hypothetical protein
MAARSIFTRLAFQADKSGAVVFNRTAVKTKQLMQQTAESTQALSGRMRGLAFGLKAAAVGFIGHRVIRSITTDYAKAADEIAKFSTATGLQVEQYQGLIHSAALAGIEQQEINKALIQLPKRARDAQIGVKKMEDAYAELGVQVTKSDGTLKSADQLLMDVADGFGQLQNESQKTALAQEIFGRSGAKLLVLLKGGSKAIKEQIAERKKLGDVIGRRAAKDAEVFNDELLRTRRIFRGIRNLVAARLLPVLNRILISFRHWATEGDNVARAMRRVKQILLVLLPLMISLVAIKIAMWWSAQVVAITRFVQLMSLIGPQLLAAAAPIVAIIAVIAALALVVEDFVGFVRGHDSVIGRLLGPEAEEVADSVRLALMVLFAEIKQSFAELKPAFQELFRELSPLITELGKAFREILPILRVILVLMIKAFVWVLIKAIRLLTLMIRLFTWLLVNAVIPLARVLVQGVLGALQGIWTAIQAIGNAFVWLWDGIVSASHSGASRIGTALDWLGEKAKGAGSKIKGWMISAWDALEERSPRTASTIKRIWDGMAFHASKTGSAVADAWRRSSFSVKGIWTAVTQSIVALWEGVSEAARAAFKFMLDLLGFDTGGEGGDFARVQRQAFGREAPAATATAVGGGIGSINISGINVKVEGSVDMTSEDFEKNVRRGARRAFQDAINQTARDRKPAVATATTPTT